MGVRTGVVNSIIERAQVEGAASGELEVAAVHEAMPRDTLMTETMRPLLPGARMAGPAVTALNAPGDNLALHGALSLTQPGDVLLVGDNGGPLAATWGGLVTRSAVARGIAGVVVDGAARDLDVIRTLELPVWATHVSPRGATKKSVRGVNVPVVCGGVLVHPGDLVVADDDGVVAVPRGDAGTVTEKARERQARESEYEQQLDEGATPYELFNMQVALSNSGAVINGGQAN